MTETTEATDDVTADDHTDTPTSSDETVQLNFEVPARLREKWRRAVRTKHGKYQGASKDEAQRMIESWADAILTDADIADPDPSNRDILDVITHRFDDLEAQLDDSTSPTPSGDDRQTKNNPGATTATEDPDTATETGGDTHRGDTSDDSHQTKNNPVPEQPSEPAEFWDAYNPDADRDEPISAEYLRAVDTLSSPKIHPEHLADPNERDGYPPGDIDTRAAIVAAVLRYKFDEVELGALIGWTKDVTGTETDWYVRQNYVPKIADEFVEDETTDRDGPWYTSQDAYAERWDEHEQMLDALKHTIMKVMCADSVDELEKWANKLGVPEIIHNYDKVARVRDDVLDEHSDALVDTGLVLDGEVEMWRAILTKLANEMKPIEHPEAKSNGKRYTDAYLSGQPSTMGKWLDLYLSPEWSTDDTATDTDDPGASDNPEDETNADAGPGPRDEDDATRPKPDAETPASAASTESPVDAAQALADAEIITDDADDSIQGEITTESDVGRR